MRDGSNRSGCIGLIAQVGAARRARRRRSAWARPGWVGRRSPAALVTTARCSPRPGPRRDASGSGPADRVTLTRATLVGGVAALVADSFAGRRPSPCWSLLAAVALVLDAVDGRVARRTGTASPLGARFDMEVDAFLILVLSVYVARSVGPWVLAIGAARYAFVAAGWLLPWLRGPAPPRYWRKVVAAIQGIVLTVAVAGRAAAASATDVALVGRAGPAGRVVRPRRVVAVASRTGCSRCGACPARLRGRPDGDRRGRLTRRPRRPRGDGGRRDSRRDVLDAITVLAFVAASGSPWSRRTRSSQLTPGAFVRIPLEGLVVVRRPALSLPARRSADPGRRGRRAARRADHREDPRHGLLRGARPAVQPGDRLELLRPGRRRAAATRSVRARAIAS